MTSTPGTVKVQPTRQKIHQAFLALYAQKPINLISIKELTYAAGINRGTFYLHYFDLPDLIDSLEREHLAALASKMENFPDLLYVADDSEALAQFFVPVLKYIETNKTTFQVLLSMHSRPNFRQELHVQMRRNLMLRVQKGKREGDSKTGMQQQLVLEYIISANLGVIIHWILAETRLSAEDVTSILSKISLHGPFQLLSAS